MLFFFGYFFVKLLTSKITMNNIDRFLSERNEAVKPKVRKALTPLQLLFLRLNYLMNKRKIK